MTLIFISQSLWLLEFFMESPSAPIWSCHKCCYWAQRNLTFSVSLTGKENFNALKATKIFWTRQGCPTGFVFLEQFGMERQIMNLGVDSSEGFPFRETAPGSDSKRVCLPPQDSGRLLQLPQGTGWRWGMWSENCSMKRQERKSSPWCHVE